jgi:hypothetical protein
MVLEEQINHLSKRYCCDRDIVKDVLNKSISKDYVKSDRFPNDKAYRLTERYLRFKLYKVVSEE